MKIYISLVVLLSVINLFPQNLPQIGVELSFYDWDSYKSVKVGVDPLATDGIDTLFGESDLPPVPPMPSTEVRFYLPEGDFSGIKSSYFDFRNGSQPYTGTIEHRFYIQCLTDSIQLSYNLLPGLTCDLQDMFGGVVVNHQMVNSGNYVIQNVNNLQVFKLIANYTNVVDVDEPGVTPETFGLKQNYPNPFNPSTTIEFYIEKESDVKLQVINMLGEVVGTLVDANLSAGNHKVKFNASGLSSGMYLYKLTSDNKTELKKMCLLK